MPLNMAEKVNGNLRATVKTALQLQGHKCCTDTNGATTKIDSRPHSKRRCIHVFMYCPASSANAQPFSLDYSSVVET